MSLLNTIQFDTDEKWLSEFDLSVFEYFSFWNAVGEMEAAANIGARTWPAAGRLFPLPARIRCTAGVSKQRVRQPSDSSGFFPIFLRIFGYPGCSFFGQAILVFSDSRFNPSRGKEEIRGTFRLEYACVNRRGLLLVPPFSIIAREFDTSTKFEWMNRSASIIGPVGCGVAGDAASHVARRRCSDLFTNSAVPRRRRLAPLRRGATQVQIGRALPLQFVTHLLGRNFRWSAQIT